MADRQLMTAASGRVLVAEPTTAERLGRFRSELAEAGFYDEQICALVELACKQLLTADGLVIDTTKEVGRDG